MSDSFNKIGEDAAAFQKMCLENFTKTFQAAFNVAPDGAPPEVLRKVRAGILQALSESWDEFMRSPQFLDGMRQWMDNAIAFRKISNDFMGRVRNDIQAPSRNDIDTVMSAMRHMEKRVLDRLDEVERQCVQLKANQRKGQRPIPGQVAREQTKQRRASPPRKTSKRRAAA